jgi:hypothetical protein
MVSVRIEEMKSALGELRNGVSPGWPNDVPIRFVLPSFHHPADQCSCREAYRKGRRNSEHKVSLDALSCVIQEFFGSIAALFCGTPHYSYAVLYCIGNRAGCTRGLVS